MLIRYHGVIHVAESTRKRSAAANAWPDASLPSKKLNQFQPISNHCQTFQTDFSTQFLLCLGQIARLIPVSSPPGMAPLAGGLCSF